MSGNGVATTDPIFASLRHQAATSSSEWRQRWRSQLLSNERRTSSMRTGERCNAQEPRLASSTTDPGMLPGKRNALTGTEASTTALGGRHVSGVWASRAAAHVHPLARERIMKVS
jgi:hypothetical protein